MGAGLDQLLSTAEIAGSASQDWSFFILPSAKTTQWRATSSTASLFDDSGFVQGRSGRGHRLAASRTVDSLAY